MLDYQRGGYPRLSAVVDPTALTNYSGQINTVVGNSSGAAPAGLEKRLPGHIPLQLPGRTTSRSHYLCHRVPSGTVQYLCCRAALYLLLIQSVQHLVSVPRNTTASVPQWTAGERPRPAHHACLWSLSCVTPHHTATLSKHFTSTRGSKRGWRFSPPRSAADFLSRHVSCCTGTRFGPLYLYRSHSGVFTLAPRGDAHG